MHELALFAGAGGGILGGKLLGWTTVCAVEIEPYARAVLMARQDDGNLPAFPIWDDVRTFDGRPWRGMVDIITGGFPCQDISVAGDGDGLDGERSGLWRDMRRIIGEVGCRYVLVENSPALTVRGLGTILGDLASLGYDASWGVLGAHHAGAPHERERIWIVAYAAKVAGTAGLGHERWPREIWGRNREELSEGYFRIRMETEPMLARVADGLAHRVDRLIAIGNGQVPAVAALAWLLLQPSENPGCLRAS